MRATEKKKIRQQLELKRREANEAYRRSQTVNREATAETAAGSGRPGFGKLPQGVSLQP